MSDSMLMIARLTSLSWVMDVRKRFSISLSGKGTLGATVSDQGLVGGPLLMRPGALCPMGPPLNPALMFIM